MGWSISEGGAWVSCGGGFGAYATDWNPAEDIRDAMRVVDAMGKMSFIADRMGGGDSWHVSFGLGNERVYCISSSLCQAICSASIKAINAGGKHD